MYHEPLWGTRSSHEKAQVFLKPSMKISLSLHLSKLWTRNLVIKTALKARILPGREVILPAVLKWFDNEAICNGLPSL